MFTTLCSDTRPSSSLEDAPLNKVIKCVYWFFHPFVCIWAPFSKSLCFACYNHVRVSACFVQAGLWGCFICKLKFVCEISKSAIVVLFTYYSMPITQLLNYLLFNAPPDFLIEKVNEVSLFCLVFPLVNLVMCCTQILFYHFPPVVWWLVVTPKKIAVSKHFKPDNYLRSSVSYEFFTVKR